MGTQARRPRRPRKTQPYSRRRLKGGNAVTAWKCKCCDNLVCMVRVEDASKWKIIFLATWDGNPWYVQGVHLRHPITRWWANREKKRYERWSGLFHQDPLFVLED